MKIDFTPKEINGDLHIALKFVRHDPPYAPGDIAWFPVRLANNYISSKSARRAVADDSPIDMSQEMLAAKAEIEAIKKPKALVTSIDFNSAMEDAIKAHSLKRIEKLLQAYDISPDLQKRDQQRTEFGVKLLARVAKLDKIPKEAEEVPAWINESVVDEWKAEYKKLCR